MEKIITLREYEDADAAGLENIIRATWQYDRFCSPKTAGRMARLYLLSCLGRQSFTRVAVRDGVPVGIIMARDLRLNPAGHFRMRLARAEGRMLCSREGRFVLKAFSGIDSVDEGLLHESGKNYDGELVFFAVSESCRGTGIGKRLFGEAMAYMDAQGISRFYLYTDSSCNYGFYEHQGMKRCGEQVHSVPIGVDNTMRFYLYEQERARV